MGFESSIHDWDGIAVVTRVHRPTDTWMFVALHDDALGTPVGGTRLRIYDRPEDGLLDAQRLARGMSHKWAAIDLPFGGGKAVLAASRALSDAERRDLLRAYAELLETLRGAFQTGEDLGTTPADMAYLGRFTRHVHGIDPSGGSAKDPGPYTARGVVAAIRAALDVRFGSRDLAGRTVVVQGVGDVGAPLARLLASAGAQATLADPDPVRLGSLVAEIGARTVVPDLAYDLSCDVFAPCAVGQVVNASTVPRLACAIVAGSANNQCDRPEDADAATARGIVMVPDFVANAGGALAFGSMNVGVTGEDEIARRLDGLEDRVREILLDARSRGESPTTTAVRRVEQVLAEARAAGRDRAADA